MGCHFLLQGIFLTQELNPHLLHLLHWQVDFFFYHCTIWEAHFIYSSVYMDCSLPGSSVHGIFQVRVLEWVAIAFSALSLYIQSINQSLGPVHSTF